MPAGRYRIPTKIKEKRGTIDPRWADKNEMQPDEIKKPPRAPRTLKRKEEREVWRKVAKQLRKLGILTVVDLEILAAYCREICAYHRYQDQVDKEGEVIEYESG